MLASNSNHVTESPIRILYCDDNGSFQQDFVRRHSDQNFEISTISDLGLVTNTLESLRSESKFPDVLLLDLFHPVDRPDFELRRAAAETQLRVLREEINRTRQAVYEAWSPSAIPILASIRKLFDPVELPVIVYTQFGFLLVQGDDIRRIEEDLEAGWLIKGGPDEVAALEADRIKRVVRDHRTAPSNRVFIGHGGKSDAWNHLAMFISEDLGLEFEEFNHDPAAGRTHVENLERMLARVGFAVLVFTAEDELETGESMPRPNVIHELGLCQGRLGFDRSFVLLENGCTTFSNLDGTNFIPFDRSNVDAAFSEIGRLFAARGLRS